MGFLNICLDCTFQFSQIPKEIENWDYWILVRKLQRNKSEWKLKIFTWILSQFRTTNLNVFFTSAEWNFLLFQRSKFQNFRRLNNGDDELAYTISCFRKIISQYFQSQRWFCMISCTGQWQQGHFPTFSNSHKILNTF